MFVGGEKQKYSELRGPWMYKDRYNREKSIQYKACQATGTETACFSSGLSLSRYSLKQSPSIHHMPMRDRE